MKNMLRLSCPTSSPRDSLPALITFTKDAVTVGRNKAAVDIHLDGGPLPNLISRRHASFQRNAASSRWQVVDHKSMNGVYVNGTRIPPELPFTLQEGDVIIFADPRMSKNEFRFIFQIQEDDKIDLRRSLTSCVTYTKEVAAFVEPELMLAGMAHNSVVETAAAADTREKTKRKTTDDRLVEEEESSLLRVPTRCLTEEGRALDDPGASKAKETEENDDAAEEESSSLSKRLRSEKPLCRYGADCYRKNADHIAQFYHPPKPIVDDKTESLSATSLTVDRSETGCTVLGVLSASEAIGMGRVPSLAATTLPPPASPEHGPVVQYWICGVCEVKNDMKAPECRICSCLREEVQLPTSTDRGESSETVDSFDGNRDVLHKSKSLIVTRDPTEIERCPLCLKDFPLMDIVSHIEHCNADEALKARYGQFLPPTQEMEALKCLSETQRRAVDYVIHEAKRQSDAAYGTLVKRVKKLGYTEQQMTRTLRYIRDEAPIIIHCNLQRLLPFLIKDPVYRNQFETRTSGGSTDLAARTAWEDRMFQKIYGKGCPAGERCKYGVLNIVGDLKGVQACYHYGDSFLSLKKVRLRTTFASMDSSSPATILASCESHCHVLQQYSDAELSAVIDVAIGSVPFHDSRVITSYKEVQIHGPIVMSEHVEAIVVNARHSADEDFGHMLDEFAKISGCNIIWMDSPDTGGFPVPTPAPPSRSRGRGRGRGSFGTKLAAMTAGRR